MSTAEIKIENVGPIESLRIPVPEEGGVVVLKARNGRGKSQAIDATRAALKGKGSLSVRDGELRGGVEAFGVKVTVGKVTRRAGELTALHLEDRLDIADLVDPGIKAVEAADAKRIKALIGVQGIKADPAMFYPLTGGEEDFNRIVPAAKARTSDLVEMAAAVKRALEAQAREETNAATHAESEAAGRKEAADGADMDAEDDATKLQADLEAAINRDADLRARHSAGVRARDNANNARKLLDQSVAAHQGPTLEQAIAEVKGAGTALDTAKQRLAEAKRQVDQCQRLYDAAFDRRDTALQHENNIAMLQETINKAAGVEIPSDLDLTHAAAQVTGAREAVERGALVRAAKEKMRIVADLEENAKAHRDQAEQLRQAARATDEVLSDAVGEGPLRVEAGRLITDTPRGKTYYGDLSTGERWTIALRLAAVRVGTGGVITCQQEAWEGLDPQNRQLIADEAKRLSVTIITAEADGGELKAEEFAN